MIRRLRWVIRAAWRRLGHLGGDFRDGERSERAAALTERWATSWPGRLPLVASWPDVDLQRDRWVRFHSLPESKRHPDSDAEMDEVIRRHRTVLSELGADGIPLTIIATDWDHADLAGGWTREHLAGAWPWMRWRDRGDEPGDPWSHYWVAERETGDELDELLRLVARDIGHFTISPPDFSWLYRPYDGGADVHARTPAERDLLRERHAGWLSSHPRGS